MSLTPTREPQCCNLQQPTSYRQRLNKTPIPTTTPRCRCVVQRCDVEGMSAERPASVRSPTQTLTHSLTPVTPHSLTTSVSRLRHTLHKLSDEVCVLESGSGYRSGHGVRDVG